MRFQLFLGTFLFLSSINLLATDLPGGTTRTAVSSPAGRFEFMLTPSHTIAPAGAHLSTELRYQHSDDVGFAAGFGAGEIGYHVGGNATWFIAPDLEGQPAFSVSGGLYFNRLLTDSSIVLKAAPTVSKTFVPGWGKVTPYAAFQFAPGLGLDGAPDKISLKGSGGLQFAINDWKGLLLHTEFGLGIVNSFHEVIVGISYPFEKLGS